MRGRHRNVLLIVGEVFLFGVLATISSNIAANNLPESWKSYYWLAWPLFGLCIIASIAVAIWQEYHKSEQSPDAHNLKDIEAIVTRISSNRQVGTGLSSASDENLAPPVGARTQSDQTRSTFLTISPYADIPLPPQPYIAHIYTLMQTDTVVGREQELNRLEHWIGQPDSPDAAKSVFVIRAMGGMGKSALAWQYFNEVVPKTGKALVGRMWWNFYVDPNFEHFIRRALLYASKLDQRYIDSLKRSECEDRLISIFQNEPYFLVLDGLERILNAYPAIDTESIQAISNIQNAGAQNELDSLLQLQNPLRQTTDPRAGLFLRALAQSRVTRVLISTRLYPAILQMDTGEALPSCVQIELQGLSDADALALWNKLGMTGDPFILSDMFRSFRNYPLLIKVLAGLVARDRAAAGDFNTWRQNNLPLDLIDMPLATVRQHVLAAAVQSLDLVAQEILYSIAAARTSLTYAILVGLLVGYDRACSTQQQLNAQLADLDDRGLLGWDKKNNRYDIHPIVQNHILSKMSPAEKKVIFQNLYIYFTALPKVKLSVAKDWSDLFIDIEIYGALIGLNLYDRAFQILRTRLAYVLLELICDNSRVIDLTKMLFPQANEEEYPLLTHVADQAYTFHLLARAYQFSEQPGRAVPLHQKALKLFTIAGRVTFIENTRVLLADALHATGELYESERLTHELASDPKTQDYSRAWLWIQFLLMSRGATRHLHRAPLRKLASRPWKRNQPSANNIALGMFRLKRYKQAFALATRAEEQFRVNGFPRDLIRAMRLKGAINVQTDHLDDAEPYLNQALSLSRKVNYAEVELPALIDLANLERKRGHYARAREYLGRVWTIAKYGPYPLIHADAWNVLARIEQDEGHFTMAIKAAQEAYRLSWCDGPIYLYKRGCEDAQAILRELHTQNTLPGMPQATYPVLDNSRMRAPNDLL